MFCEMHLVKEIWEKRHMMHGHGQPAEFTLRRCQLSTWLVIAPIHVSVAALNNIKMVPHKIPCLSDGWWPVGCSSALMPFGNELSVAVAPELLRHPG